MLRFVLKEERVPDVLGEFVPDGVGGPKFEKARKPWVMRLKCFQFERECV